MSAQLYLNTPIEFAKGVGPLRADLLKKELKIFTFGDLLLHFPYRYIDRTQFYSINQIATFEDAYIQLKGVIRNIQDTGIGRAKRVTATLSDETGNITLVWFQGTTWIKKAMEPNAGYIVYGKPSEFNGKWNIVHPEIELLQTHTLETGKGLQPLYPSTEKLKAKGLDNKNLGKIIRQILNGVSPQDLPENLPYLLLNENKFPSRYSAINNIHFPENEHLLKPAIQRLKFEELFFIQLQLLTQKNYRQKRSQSFVLKKENDNALRVLYEKLVAQNFKLTSDQIKVLEEIRQDVGSGKQMNRLLQGDVGSGKTIVALFAMLMAVDNGFQACVMAPTEILAQQHLESFQQHLAGSSVAVALLTGSVKGKARKEILNQIASGGIHLLIGTHALIEDQVKFQNLALIVIDEQHRFGVAQRAKLWEKNQTVPHILVMTATPIPRTLAMTLYGDLDTSVIKTMPPGRKNIITKWVREDAIFDVFELIKTEIDRGRQIYIVYPLIEESEKMDYKDLIDGFDTISRAFPIPKYQISIVHGKMKPEAKANEMERFIAGKTDIMIATTVIEVGVDVPNASLIVIQSAERFGITQLHQLRGRVGRGSNQSYCILISGNKLSNEAKKRLHTMTQTQDGFEIAEVDLQLRGPGMMEGTQQSGHLNLKLADLSKDQDVLQNARIAVLRILQHDPELLLPEHQGVKRTLSHYNQMVKKWGKIA